MAEIINFKNTLFTSKKKETCKENVQKNFGENKKN